MSRPGTATNSCVFVLLGLINNAAESRCVVDLVSVIRLYMYGRIGG